MSFITYDIAFLVLFVLAVVTFLYTHKSNLKRQGLLYLYRTKIGLNLIEYTTKRFSKILKPLQYIVVVCGYILMIEIIWLFLKFAYFYITSPFAAREFKIPVIMPLIPYLPEIFKIDFLPPFPFTYWIIIIALIAIPHEFAHGIFARLNKIPVHSTGFGFLGPFLAAFVEPDEKKMEKAKKFPQMSILASGTFANVLTAILFAVILWIFFTLAFVPAGVQFNTYALTSLNISGISKISNVTLDGFENNGILTPNIQLMSGNEIFFTSDFILQQTIKQGGEQIIAYENSPAFNARLKGAITSIDSTPIASHEQLKSKLQSYAPGDTISLTTINDNKEQNYNITLAGKEGNAFIGIGFIPPSNSGMLGKVYSFIGKVKDPAVYYSSLLGEFGFFIFHLLWWIVMISFSVAFVNMIPVGIFDGGRFFYLTVWGLTKSKEFAKKAFTFSTWFILLIIAMLMAKWVFAFL